MKTRIAVFVSGGGTHLQALIDAQGKVLQSGEIALVVSNNAGAYALERAKKAGIPTAVVLKKECGSQAAFEERLKEVLTEHGIEVIILAGFMTILTEKFTSCYPKRILNVHPSLIPAFCGEGFYGLRVHEAALRYGVKVTGATVHFVNEIPDGGEIIAGAEVAAKPKVSSEAAGKGVFADDLMKVEDIKNGYCTQFLLHKDADASVTRLRAFLESNGDSVVVIEDDDVANCHVHTSDPGMMLSEAIKYGYLTNFKIENMHEQFLARQKQGKSLEKQASAEKAPSQSSEFIYAAVDPSRDYGFVAVAAGEGLKAVFTDLSADAVVSGGQTMNPATEDILAAIQSVPAKTVFVLPNNKNIIMAAEQAQKLADRQVVVLPTRTVPMGITALLNFDPSVNAETNTINMMAAADKVSTGLITYAARDSEFDGKPIKKGEIMALENGKIVATGTDLVKMTYRLARSMKKKDTQFITVISGCDVSDEDAEKTTELVRAKCGSSVEVSHISGGQPVYYYMISVE